MTVYHPPAFFKGKKIVLGVTGSIAAFKAAALASYLTKAGARVTVCMTEHARRLVGESTFEAITGNRVYSDLFAQGGSIVHIALARESDVILILPATANIIGKIAAGIADDLLSTLVLVEPQKVVVAPAMNVSMWKNPLVQENVDRLRRRGIQIIAPVSGILACGEEGEGRLPELEDLAEEIFYCLHMPRKLEGKKVLVTAGATREWIDPVRFVSNPSSGFMGCALAAVAKAWGAEVRMIMGVSSVRMPSSVVVERVETVAEMKEALERGFPLCDILFMNAAVSDFCPSSLSLAKIKKERTKGLTISFVPAPDLLEGLAQQKKNQTVVGFCAETEDPLSEAKRKLKKKNLDMMVANLIEKGKSGFEVPTNKAWIVKREGEEVELPLLDKRELAEAIVTHLVSLL
ncbi:MAG: bifunctional phosphopantothenoylcysteine decarboxylase/phosphopantothenate--cysteine ligase CoaBC [Candidatus Atribacteria bacterium]|nr:bifunctional phosphopantothenoylcysteine decarboxylase/phosphopantothenate--cysteine ligase CoaBC [Candidatus Atribacteria bacterium]